MSAISRRITVKGSTVRYYSKPVSGGRHYYASVTEPGAETILIASNTDAAKVTAAFERQVSVLRAAA